MYRVDHGTIWISVYFPYALHPENAVDGDAILAFA